MDQGWLFTGKVKCTKCNFKSINSFIIFLYRIKKFQLHPSFSSLSSILTFQAIARQTSFLRVTCDQFSLLLKAIWGFPGLQGEIWTPQSIVPGPQNLFLLSSTSSPFWLHTPPTNQNYSWNPGHTLPYPASTPPSSCFLHPECFFLPHGLAGTFSSHRLAHTSPSGWSLFW